MPDTVSDVSHRRAERAPGARRGSAVSNSAARVVNKRVTGNLIRAEFVDGKDLRRMPIYAIREPSGPI